MHHDFIAAAAAAYTYCLGHEKPVILKAKGEIRYKSVEEYIVFRTLAFSYKIKSGTAAKIELFEKGK